MDWKEHGVKIVHARELDMKTPQTSGMTRAAAITHARTGAEKLWAGTMVVQPDAKTGPHHHGELETVLYVVKGRVRMRWGDHLELSEEARAEISRISSAGLSPAVPPSGPGASGFARKPPRPILGRPRVGLLRETRRREVADGADFVVLPMRAP